MKVSIRSNHKFPVENVTQLSHRYNTSLRSSAMQGIGSV
jgi:hypothetical protein